MRRTDKLRDIRKNKKTVALFPSIWYNEWSIHYNDLNALADMQIGDLLPAIGRLYHNASLLWYNEWSIHYNDLNALADTQIGDLLPAIGRLYHNASLLWYNE
ncbi:hypothetical protein [uncultured Ruminococcus sp.]|uniref:hypothetical protein n=1 Tax=uncultured Ruminococcus sp. TaxID=165186 RepID=UPI00261AC1AE|nr:hypothetical protein [uncultured Ruminococcus sp.]